jgi:hypothetical protein
MPRKHHGNQRREERCAGQREECVLPAELYGDARDSVTGKPAREVADIVDDSRRGGAAAHAPEIDARGPGKVRVGTEEEESGHRHQKPGRWLAGVARHAREDQPRRTGPNRKAQGWTGESLMQTAERAGPRSLELTGGIRF